MSDEEMSPGQENREDFLEENEEEDEENGREEENGDGGEAMEGLEEEEVDMAEMDNIEEKIEQTRQAVQMDPADYDSALLLLRLLRMSGELEELNATREQMLLKFPLPVKEWLKWIKDMRSLNTDRAEVEKLFRRALEDSPHYDIWLEFVLWTIAGNDNTKSRDAFEEAITACGLRVDQGGQLWLAYIDFEELSGGIDNEKRDKIWRSLYARALRVPTIALGDIWEKYLQLTDNKPEANVKASHKAAQAMIVQLRPFEEKVFEEENSLKSLLEYLKWELKKGDPARIQSFFERILEQHPLEELVWIDYTRYVEKVIKIPKVILAVYERAVRHCPGSCALWQPLLLAEERAKVPLEKIQSLWTNARENIQTPEEGRALYRTYIFLLRRLADARGDTNYESIAEVFEDGAKVLAELFGRGWDPTAEYRRNQAFFYFDKLGQAERGRKIWEDILASGGGRLAETWLEAVRLERFYGEIEKVRKLFYRAVNSVSDHPQQVFAAFVQFEREEGTLEQLEIALDKVNAQLQRRDTADPYQDRKSKEEEKRGGKEITNGRAKKREAERSERPDKSKRPRVDTVDVSKKDQTPVVKDKDGFLMPTLPAPRSPAMKKEEKKAPSGKDSEGTSGGSVKAITTETGKDGKWTLFVSNLDFKATEDEIKEVLQGVVEVRLLYRGMSKLHKGYGYVDFESEKAYREALAKDRVPINGRPMYVNENQVEKEKRNPGFKFGTGLEKNKLFVKNIHYDSTADQIKEIFATYGDVKEVRIVTHKSGKSKGVAYVDMKDDAGAEAACKAEEILLFGRKLGVFLSNPPKKSEGGIMASIGRQKDHPLGRIGHSSKIDFVPRNVVRKAAAESVADSEAAAGEVKAAPKMGNEQFRQFFSK